ncbi:hypothetical protein BHU72_01505 [Desulfuribacillus stibiiarsenatis]|uniref:NapC/NirT cytochrome c N-terminal domain-containing protein n=1 Tax=Desulfuribacillus stibiiarsenatis TaxID=1390249 RepID=A0A1E5LA16_9FIRM|nr:NapC/NirT family cytochrome c [Desulfuribacillus stibiiarsenatis]OEH86961.1 hypothetical protein BHU72_01505 [Desulfuribacillus stibiiarsenatis]
MAKFDKKKLWIIGIIAAVVIIGGSVGAIKYTSTNAFCVLCHTYEENSWMVGQHPEVNCITCHTKGLIMDKTVGIKKVFLTATGMVDPWHDKLPVKFKEEKCIACHFEPATDENKDLIDRHAKYTENVEGCLTCHGNVGHVQEILNEKYEYSKQQQ